MGPLATILLAAILLAALAPAGAAAAPKGAPAAAPKGPPAAAPAANPLAAFYAALPEAERIAIQDDLVWTGLYNGVVDGDFNNRAVAAVKAFQKRRGGKETGMLNPPERAALAAAARQRRTAAGWQTIVDPMTGSRFGVPAKLVGAATRSASGSRWASAHGEIEIETFRLPPGTALQAAYERQRTEPPQRKPSYNILRPGFFVVTGLQGQKKFYVRAQEQDGVIRGFSILYDQATEGAVDPVVIAMSNAFAAAPAGPPPRRKVEYASAVVLDAAGHLATTREATEGCQTITVAGLGPAVLAADDKDSGLALLRVYGARRLTPVRLADAAPDGPLTLVGIADPQTQAGGGAATRVAASAAGTAVTPVPAPGFAGAAALDREGRLAGIVDLKPQIVTGPPAGGHARLIPAATIRAAMLPFGGIAADAGGAAGADAAAASVLRVICTRK